MRTLPRLRVVAGCEEERLRGGLPGEKLHHAPVANRLDLAATIAGAAPLGGCLCLIEGFSTHRIGLSYSESYSPISLSFRGMIPVVWAHGNLIEGN